MPALTAFAPCIAFGPGPRKCAIAAGALPNAIEKIGIALLLPALAPIIVPMLMFPIGKILLEGFATWRATGAWPRNEAFIARMKAKHAQKP